MAFPVQSVQYKQFSYNQHFLSLISLCTVHLPWLVKIHLAGMMIELSKVMKIMKKRQSLIDDY